MAYLMTDRMQQTLLPPVVDDYIGPEDPVRVYDAFVNALNVKELGLKQIPQGNADQYDPKVLLKLLIYGYAYGIRSTRKLERACYHNLSFIWLVGNLKPDHRTIGRFRQDNKETLKKVLKQCVQLCMKFNLIDGNALFIDGSAIRANASIQKTWDKERCDSHMRKIYKHIDQIVDESQEDDFTEEQKTSLVQLNQDLKDLKELKESVETFTHETQRPALNTTDKDSVTMRGRQGIHASYNAQMTVDGKHGLIVNSDTISHSQDANKFSGQIQQATDILGKKPDIACSDSGYHSLDDLAQVDPKIRTIIPSQKQAQVEHGHPLRPFDKDHFTYDKHQDIYICPQGQKLVYHSSAKDSRRHYKARGATCYSCRHFGCCTSSKNGRLITRMKHEVLQQKLVQDYDTPEGKTIYQRRNETVELVFGHIKRNLHAGYLLLRGRNGANAELSLLSTGFNITRMITLIGVAELIARLQG